MRLIFMGTPDFAATALGAVIAAGHDIACVYTQPPRPSGRGHKTRESPVHRLADRHGIAVRHPASLKDPADQAGFAALEADVAVVAAYGLLLPRPILDAPRLGCVNIHASLLPRWRGAAPIQRAILAGDTRTGVGIMRMETGLDTGPILMQRAIDITAGETAQTLHDRLAALGAELMVQALVGLAQGTITETPQAPDGVTYAAKITKQDGLLTFADAAYAARQARALVPWPGLWFPHGAEVLRVTALEHLATVDPEGAAAGTVLDDRLTVACGTGGAVRLLALQRPGKPARDADAFLRGYPIPAGTVLAPAP